MSLVMSMQFIFGDDWNDAHVLITFFISGNDVKEWGLILSSRLWGGVLRDDTKNGCVVD